MTWKFGPLQAFGYDLLVADPPWKFRTYTDGPNEKGANAHYEIMSLEDIRALPVLELASRNALLLLWCPAWAIATGQAQDVARGWGFDPITEIVWNKRTRTGKWRVGTGYRARSMHEPILLCKIGTPKHAAFPSAFDGLARQHSRKPEEFYRMIDRYAPRLRRRADLFARTRRKGWASWGREVNKFKDAA